MARDDGIHEKRKYEKRERSEAVNVGDQAAFLFPFARVEGRFNSNEVSVESDTIKPYTVCINGLCVYGR